MAHQPTKSRKFLAGTVTAALVATAIVPTASAAEFSDIAGNTHEDAINALVDLGVINGYPDGTFQPNKTLSRSDVVKMMGKWLVTLGYEVPADYASVQRFDDVSLTGNQELLKYAALVKDTGVFNGSEGKLDPTGSITRENMALVLVRAFDEINGTDLVAHVEGEEFNQEVTDLSSAKAEARPFINVLDFYDITSVSEFMPKSTVTRGQFATFLYKTSKVEAPVDSVEVASVSATNLKEVVVTFTKDVDVNNAGTYTFAAGSGLTAAVKSVDGKSVTLAVTGTVTQQLAVDLTIDAVKDINGVSVAKTVKSVKFVDVTAPFVTSVDVSAPSKIKVTFSEPLSTKPTFTVDDGFIAIASDDFVAGTKVVELTLGATPSEGLHKVTINGGEDYAGFKVEKVERQFNYIKDVTAPTFAVKSANETQVVLEFNEPISNVGDGNVEFYHTNVGTSAYLATKTLAADGKTLTLTFANPLPTGNVALFLSYAVDSGTKLQDTWGNKVAETSFSANVVVDAIAPTVTKVEAKSNTAIEVSFSEAVVGATTNANYVVRDAADDSIVPFTNVTQVGSTNTYSINFPTALNGGSYKVEVKNVTDDSFKNNKMTDYTTTLAIADKVAPNVDATTPALLLSAEKVKINFTEAMDVASITNKNNYLFGSAALDSAVKVTAVDNNKAVVLDFTDVTSGAQAGALTGTTINVGRVADANGNLIAALTTAVTVPGTISAPLFKKAEVVGEHTVKFYFDQVISGIVATDFEVSNDNGANYTAVTAITNISIADGKTVVTATTPLSLPSSAANVVVQTGATVSGENQYGADILIAADTATTDKYAPEFTSAQAIDAGGNGKVEAFNLTFSENLYVASVQENDFSVEGYEITGVSTSGSTVTLSVKEKATSDLTATPKVTLVGAVEDGDRNVRNTQDVVTAASVSAANAAADAAAASAVQTEIANAVGQTAIETARANYTALTATQKALVTNEATLQSKEQALVDAVTLAPAGTYAVGSTPAGAQVSPTAQTGYTFTITGSSDPAVIDNAGLTVGAGTATLTYTVTHTSSGKTATETMSVTVTAD